MPQESLITVENNFVGGLKTEFTGLNFPENSVTDCDNVIFDRIGRVARRKGIDLEDTGIYNTADRTGGAVNSFVWLNAAGDGVTNLFVLQTGDLLQFYEASDPSTALSGQLLATTVTLTTFQVAGTVSPKDSECQFAQGNGFLFVFHPHCEPFYIAYDTLTQTVIASPISIRIRDFTGIVETGIPDTQRPTTLTPTHRYNLGNQGWTSGYSLTSNTSHSGTVGSKTFTVNQAASTTPIVIGDQLFIRSSATPADSMTGTITAYTGTTLTVNIKTVTSAFGAHADWIVESNPDNTFIWNSVLGPTQGTFPSNVDIWWAYKNSSNVFDPASTFTQVGQTTTPASKGHYIVNPFNIDRSTISGIPGLTTVTVNGERPTTGAFFAGRVFYAGTKHTSVHNNVYFSKIIEGTDDFGRCYQTNDPSSEDFFDLLPDDGGVISIQGAGTVIKMFATRSVLVIFATNGIWTISGTGGTDGLGFTANDYSVNKVSNTKTLSASSFVEVQGVISWWTIEGIYSLQIDANSVKVESATNTTIATFYRDDIPNTSKLFARGAYNPITFVMQWVYRSTSSSTIEERYEFDKVLCFNTLTNAFYVWTISPSPNASFPTTINGVIVVDSPGGQLLINNVVRGADNVVDGAGNQVVSFFLSTNVTPVFKYIISKPVGLTYLQSFGEEYKTSYHDWVSVNSVGSNYNSTFTTGYSVHGSGLMFQNMPYINVYEDNFDEATGDSAYSIQGLWDFSNSGNSGKFSAIQRTRFDSGNFNITRRRFRIRGKGMSLRIKFASEENFPFSLVGWSKWERKNATP